MTRAESAERGEVLPQQLFITMERRRPLRTSGVCGSVLAAHQFPTNGSLLVKSTFI